MKKVECYLRQEDVEPLVKTLERSGISGLTVSPVRGFGRQRGKGAGLLPKVKVEIFVLEIELDYVLGTVLEVTRRGQLGDGKIAILPVENVIRVRTGESGARALA